MHRIRASPAVPSPESAAYIAWDGIAEMFNQAYWHRVSIYQEATTPVLITFFCGDHSFNDILLSVTVTFVKREDIEEVLFSVCHGRRMAILSGGHLAILPAAAKYDDKLAAFRGGRTLILVRDVSRGLSLIGDCYVDGWMDGALSKVGQRSERTLKLT